jgi:hypothetical protein
MDCYSLLCRLDVNEFGSLYASALADVFRAQARQSTEDVESSFYVRQSPITSAVSCDPLFL